MFLEIVFGLILLYFLWQNLKKPSDYPPGYWGLPLIGFIPLGKQSFNEHLESLHKECGDVAIWRMGGRLMVFIYDFKLIKETLNSQDFINRPELFILRVVSQGKNLGLVGSNGELWQNNRRFTLRHLRDLGMGKSKIVSSVQYEAMELVNDLKSRAGKPSVIPHSLTVAVLNVIWQLVANHRYSLDDPELQRFEDMVQNLEKSVDRMVIPDILPWFNFVVPKFLARKITRADVVDATRNAFFGLLKKVLDAHEKEFDPNNLRDFIDEYIAEMKKRESEENSTMSMDDLLICVTDLFSAGSATTKTTLQWIMFYLASYPDVQKRLQAEVDEVLPKGTLPTLEDKPRLPYVEAVVHEVHRSVSMLPISAMHGTVRDTQLRGYKIPKGAIINPVSIWVHNDPKYWYSPNEFKPERFLDSDGKFVHPKDGFMPFGIGKRQCLGEPLARLELFIFLAVFAQNLQFSPAPGKTIDLRPNPGNPINNQPQHNQEILITIR